MAALGIAQAQVGFPDIARAKVAVMNVFPIIDRCGGGLTATHTRDSLLKGAKGTACSCRAPSAMPSVSLLFVRCMLHSICVAT